MNVGIACHSGFCVFQPVRKKRSLLSATTNTLAAISKAGRRTSTFVTGYANNIVLKTKLAFRSNSLAFAV